MGEQEGRDKEMTTAYHSQYWAHALTLRGATGTIEALSRSIAGARVDLNPRQDGQLHQTHTAKTIFLFLGRLA